MQGMSPDAEFHTNLASIIESRKRYLDFNSAQTKREQEMLKECFSKHEEMISWLWNHISHLQLDITTIQEKAFSTESPRQTSTPPPPPRSLRRSHGPSPFLVRETPRESSERPGSLLPPPTTPPPPPPKPIPHQRSAKPEPIVVPETPPEHPRSPKHSSKKASMREIQPDLERNPDLARSAPPDISFSQRLLDRKTTG